MDTYINIKTLNLLKNKEILKNKNLIKTTNDEDYLTYITKNMYYFLIEKDYEKCQEDFNDLIINYIVSFHEEYDKKNKKEITIKLDNEFLHNLFSSKKFSDIKELLENVYYSVYYSIDDYFEGLNEYDVLRDIVEIYEILMEHHGNRLYWYKAIKKGKERMEKVKDVYLSIVLLLLNEDYEKINKMIHDFNISYHKDYLSDFNEYVVALYLEIVYTLLSCDKLDFENLIYLEKVFSSVYIDTIDDDTIDDDTIDDDTTKDELSKNLLNQIFNDETYKERTTENTTTDEDKLLESLLNQIFNDETYKDETTEDKTEDNDTTDENKLLENLLSQFFNCETYKDETTEDKTEDDDTTDENKLLENLLSQFFNCEIIDETNENENNKCKDCCLKYKKFIDDNFLDLIDDYLYINKNKEILKDNLKDYDLTKIEKLGLLVLQDFCDCNLKF